MEIGTILPYLGIPSFLGAVILITRIIALARTTKIERMLMNDQKNISIFIIQSLFSAIIAALLAIYFTYLINGNENIEFYIVLFLVYLFLACASVPSVYSILSLIRKRSIHYIWIKSDDSILNTHKIKLYIHRVTFDDKVIVSNKPTLNNIQGYKKIIDKSYLYDKKIYEEKL
ncbi:hypothetical protein SAMN04488542_14921 [Fontibacillus panacisegetis]|uniref:Uncharacterized protein n=1 Tax=Fontibacillus panacisegetis TaxID=670482 RepID=A0A1G7UQB1_9BACL|nr:hypothetical protein [Fontibacillus panacisegetis]SDG49785.1 hypothetical protein SAMN04488542_14921 [Fontibacillus panacisegetis]